MHAEINDRPEEGGKGGLAQPKHSVRSIEYKVLSIASPYSLNSTPLSLFNTGSGLETKLHAQQLVLSRSA